MRLFILSTVLIGVLLSSQAWSAEPQAIKQNDAGQQGAQASKANERTSDASSPVVVKLLNTGKSEQESAQEAARIESQESTENWTIGLTTALVLATFLQFLALLGQAKQLARTVRSSERASMPFLYPRVKRFDLYPNIEPAEVGDQVTHQPSISLGFENIGKTPAMLRRIRAELLLIDRDLLPPIPPPFQNSTEVVSDAVVAPEKRAGIRTVAFHRAIPAGEIRQLLAEVEEQSFKRFFVYGYVIYDDFFGIRHTKRFCVKLRNGWQAVKGGSRYNSESESAAPAVEDPLAIQVEERRH